MWHYRSTQKPLFAIFTGRSYLQWILPNTAPLHSLLYHCIVSTYLPYCIVSICHMMIMLHSGMPLCYLIKEQLINDFQPSGEEFEMRPRGSIFKMKCRRGALCNVVDWPTQLTLIFILWYLYFMTKLQIWKIQQVNLLHDTLLSSRMTVVPSFIILYYICTESKVQLWYILNLKLDV